MKSLPNPHRAESTFNLQRHSKWTGLLLAGAFFLGLVLLLPRDRRRPSSGSEVPGLGPTSNSPTHARHLPHPVKFHSPDSGQTASAASIVAGKVLEFGRSRREIVRAIARRTGKVVPAEVERFFEAVESGDWQEIDQQWKVLAQQSAQYEGSAHAPELDPFWCAVLDAYGVAEQAHEWPAQTLLDYGHGILGSLRPGMVYVGGTDNGRWIPELLNDTSDGEHHVIITQNALADTRYLEYVTELYGDRVNTLTEHDSKRAFQEYVSDAQKRLEHDQQFPAEPKQIRPGEDVRVNHGKVEVSGQTAVMGINEKLLQTFMAKNPDLSFALQESFPLKGTYANAVPLGGLMELQSQEDQPRFTPEHAEQSRKDSRQIAQQVASDPEAAASDAALKSYSHDTVAAANLLAAHQFQAEAEESYRLAAQIWPENPESAAGLADLLMTTGRESEAQRILNEFIRQYPSHQSDIERISAAWRSRPSIP